MERWSLLIKPGTEVAAGIGEVSGKGATRAVNVPIVVVVVAVVERVVWREETAARGRQVFFSRLPQPLQLGRGPRPSPSTEWRLIRLKNDLAGDLYVPLHRHLHSSLQLPLSQLTQPLHQQPPTLPPSLVMTPFPSPIPSPASPSTVQRRTPLAALLQPPSNFRSTSPPSRTLLLASFC